MSAYTGGTMTSIGTLVGTQSKISFPYGFQVSNVAATTALHVEGHLALLYSAAGSNANTMVLSGLSAFADFRHLRFIANTSVSSAGNGTLRMNGDATGLYRWQHNGSASGVAVVANVSGASTSGSLRQFSTDTQQRTHIDLTLYYFRSTSYEKKLSGELISLLNGNMLRHYIDYRSTNAIDYVTFFAPGAGLWETAGTWQIYGIF